MERPATPPQHPTYGVHLRSVSAIVEAVFPGAASHSAQQLPSGASFNNRIYFLSVRHEDGPAYMELNPKQDFEALSYDDCDDEDAKYVIKAVGRFWGAEKVQNEAACLWLLEKHCPAVPAPRVIAWSEDGEIAMVFSPDRMRIDRRWIKAPLDGAGDSTNTGGKQGWVLMTRLPGRAVSTMDLSHDEETQVGRELARFVASWRENMPQQKHCGNVRIDQDDAAPTIPTAALTLSPNDPSSRLKVVGLVEENNYLENQIFSSLEYSTEKLRHKLRILATDGSYGPLRHLGPSIADFISTKLPRLAVARQVGSFVFTHVDLAPRNLLATRAKDGSLRVCGVVDFEFAGFFPSHHEFLSELVFNKGDLPAAVYEAYIGGLDESGIETPASREAGRGAIWEEVELLAVVEHNIEPWWLPGPFAGAELAGEFEKLEKKIRDALERLSAMSG